MRLAVLTDLHANRQALEACLAHAAASGADQYAFTGDLVGYGGDPGFVVETVREYVSRGAIAVQGNHDEAAVQSGPPHMHAEALEAMLWTRSAINDDHKAFLASLPFTASLGNLGFVHASADKPEAWTYITNNEAAERSLNAARASRIVFSGHVHAPMLFRRADDGRMGAHRPEAELAIALAPQHQYLVIPGSCGQPRDGNPAACYVLYDDQTRRVRFHRVPYDNGAAARAVIAGGLPIVFAMRLVEGI